jgi:glycosyltransferase involved in cell wall biosynthesis
MGTVPQASIVIPTYNSARYVGIAIEHVLGQTFEDFELLVLDNASTDETPDVVSGYDDRRLRYVRNPHNLGFAANAQRGLEMARGAFLTVLGADDVQEPEFLQRTVGCLQANPNLSLVHTSAVWIDEGGTVFGESRADWAPVTPGPQAFVDCFRYGFCFSALVMRREALRRAGGLQASWGDYADESLFLRLCLVGDAGYLAPPLVRYRVHSQSITSAWFRRGEYFRRHLRLISDAFEWPDARAQGLDRKKGRAVRDAAAEWTRVLHLVRDQGSWGEYARSFAEAVLAAPRIACYPSTWARLGFGLLPRSVIRTLQHWKRRRWRKRAAGVWTGPGRDSGSDEDRPTVVIARRG